MMFGNHSLEFRKSVSGKLVVGYFPVESLKPTDIREDEKPIASAWIWHFSMSFFYIYILWI